MTPSPGLIVQYYASRYGLRHVARVEAQRPDGTVDLLVFNPEQSPALAERKAVRVVIDNGERPADGDFCVWTQTPKSLFEDVEPFPLEN